jgi:hypothetical protein
MTVGPGPWRPAAATRRHGPLLAVLAAYLVAALCYVTLTPLWQAPDEPAHYNYVRYLATTAELPVLQAGDYPAQYLEQIKAAHFPPGQTIAPIRYESHQPPLYYAVASPLYQVTRASSLATQVMALRLLSLGLGLVATWLTYLLGLVLWSRSKAMAAALAGIAALVPMHTALTAAINNDTLAEVLVIATALQSALLLRRSHTALPTSRAPRERPQHRTLTASRLAFLGLLVGMCLLAKMTAFLALGLAAGVIALVCWRLRPDRATAGRGLLAFAAPVLALELPWLLRNMATYGLADPLGQARHDSIVAGQLRTGERLAQVGLPAMLREGAETTFRSFWGIFGWMGVPMDERIYLGLALLTALAAVGLLLWLWRVRRSAWPVPALGLLLIAWGLLSTAELLWYNLKFVQYQGRYLFVGMPVWAAALLLGLIEARRRGAVFALALLALAVLVFGLGQMTGSAHRLAAAGLALAGVGMAAWWAVGRRRPEVAGSAALTALWLLDLAGAVYYVHRFL